jgi:ATP-dependent helicase YprA (DUF1998 family)
MNALANDQLERLRKILRGTGLQISFGLYTGDSDSAAQSLRELPAETERLTHAAVRNDPPDIILTNYKQLEFLLTRREDRWLFAWALRFLVLEEIHSYRGALATEIACLIRRLKSHAGLRPGEIICIGTSATVASKAGALNSLARFARTIFGEEVLTDSIIGESYKQIQAPPSAPEISWIPSPKKLKKKNFWLLIPTMIIRSLP